MIEAVRRVIVAAAVSVLVGCGGGGGSDNNPAPPPTTFSDPVAYSSAAEASLPTAAEFAAVTRHQLAIDGATLPYTATAGHLTARNPASGAAEASFFYVAYTLDNAAAAQRPVTFFYNGGPGSATAWLHLGSFGPMRLVTGDPSTAATAFPLVPNPHSLLDVSDLVFVDAVGTGFSEAVAPNTNSTFWGVDADALVFRDFVMRYLAANNRGVSPKFLFGESYGTTRSAVLANVLETAGVDLDGVVLQSSILNYGSNCGVVFNANCMGFLPSYAATGAWYGLDNPNPAPADLPQYLLQARTLAATQYGPAVAQFMTTHAPPSTALLTTLVDTTGLALANWQAHFNMASQTYQRNLIPGTLIGLYDARVSTPVNNALARAGDPSSTFFEGGFASAVPAYLATLNYTTPSTYVLLGNAIQTWNFRHDGVAVPDTIPDLASAMAQNPQLRVLSVNGYHDLVTPFFQTELDLGRLDPGSNVETRFYVGGHMTYLDETSIALEKADLKAFYAGATGSP
ncbi:MAG: peptidase S10 [Betaproteobacteria bacterium]